VNLAVIFQDGRTQFQGIVIYLSVVQCIIMGIYTLTITGYNENSLQLQAAGLKVEQIICMLNYLQELEDDWKMTINDEVQMIVSAINHCYSTANTNFKTSLNK
jgi:hypothetical protein